MKADDLLGDMPEIFINWHQTLRVKVFLLVRSRRCISGLFKAPHLIANLDLLAAVLGRLNGRNKACTSGARIATAQELLIASIPS